MTPAELTAWREEIGLDKAKAAEALGCTRQTLRNYETGVSEIPRYIELATRQLSTEWAMARKKKGARS